MEIKLHNQKLFKAVSSILNLTGFRSKMKNISCYEMPTNNVNPNKPYLKRVKLAVFVALFSFPFINKLVV